VRRRGERHRRGDARIRIDVPLVIRLTGTNEKEALRILNDAGFTRPRRWTRSCRRPSNSPGRPERTTMAIFIDQNTKLLVQGITGRDGSFHARQMMEYGTQVVGGVTPGKGGQSSTGPDGVQVPIFDTVEQAVRETGANASVIYVPPPFAADAIMEAADANVRSSSPSPRACRCWT
jgi:hypothetical protein